MIVPGIILVLLSLWAFTGLDKETTATYIITINMLLYIGISLVMTPAQTAGLNALPRRLFPHGAAILNTLMQIAGAIGIAMFIGIVSRGSKNYLDSSNESPTLSEQLSGFSAGIQNAFWCALFIGVVALVVSLFIKRTEPSE